MNEGRPQILIPALAGGVLGGVLSGVPFLNCLCCLWIIGGGVLAAHLLVRSTKTSLNPGDGAKVGAVAGLLAAVIERVLSIPLAPIQIAFLRRFMARMAEYVKEMPAGWDRIFDRPPGGITLPWFFVGLFITAAVFAAFGALGGVIGMSLFNRRLAAAPPSPPLPPQEAPPS